MRGGPSSEYDVSLKSGATILNALDREKYEPRDLFISRQGEWHAGGIALPPERALAGVDVAFNVIHGAFGEDGRVQRLLERHAVPYTGADAFASIIAFNKERTKDIARRAGIKVAHGVVAEPGGDVERQAFELFRSFPHPAIVKPVVGGSSVATTLADSYHALEHGLREAFKVAPAALVEEFIRGREATVGVVDGFRGQPAYALLPVEIASPPGHAFFSWDAKYGGQSTERCPGNFTPQEKHALERAAIRMHQEMELAHYSRSDFIVSPRGIYFLEINPAAAVGMTEESLFPKALAAVGASLAEFTDHVVSLALRPRAV